MIPHHVLVAVLLAIAIALLLPEYLRAIAPHRTESWGQAWDRMSRSRAWRARWTPQPEPEPDIDDLLLELTVTGYMLLDRERRSRSEGKR